MGESENEAPPGPGFQTSDKSGVKVSFFGHGDDPVLGIDKYGGRLDVFGAAQFNGREAVIDFGKLSAISRVTWSKAMGAPSGRFEIDVKTNDPDRFERSFADDDWLDLSFLQHNRIFHTCRGLIDTIRSRGGVQNGATTKTFTFAGRDHGKIFEKTDVFFNRYIGENVGGGATLRAFVNANASNIFGPPSTTVAAFLFEFLRQLNGSSNARWQLPLGLSAAGSVVYFKDLVKYNVTGYSDYPPRVAYKPAFINPEGFVGHNLWALAQEWSDPSFCELFCDLVKDDGSFLQPGTDEELDPKDSTLGVILRDKPFLTNASIEDTIGDGPWTRLPLNIVRVQELETGTDVGRGGDERFNTFFVRTAATSEYSDANLDITKPLWNPEDVAIRGIRRMDVSSNYVSPTSANERMVRTMREQIRDWYGLNPYYYNGTLPIAHLRPDIRIGSRLRIPGPTPDLDVTYYVEGVSHTWQLGHGRTVVTVTRGWKGTDASQIAAVNDLANDYDLPGQPVIDDTVTYSKPGGENLR